MIRQKVRGGEAPSLVFHTSECRFVRRCPRFHSTGTAREYTTETKQKPRYDMRHLSITLIVLCSLSVKTWAQALQDDVEFKQQSATMRSDYVQVGITLRNVTKHALKAAYVDCAALAPTGDIIETGTAAFRNLRPGETAYDFAQFFHVHQTSMKFECRVANVFRSDD